MWPSIREFLRIPEELTGKNVGIAVVDGRFPNHPDIAANACRNTYIVKTSESNPHPMIMEMDNMPWNGGVHGLWTAAAAAGSGQLSQGHYAGAAPDANLFLLETGSFITVEEIESKFVAALKWLRKSWRRYNIRGVVLTVASTRDTGLLPWQADPIRILCEQLVHDGLLVVVASGNTIDLTCSGPASSPSVLSVGGVIMPKHLDIYDAKPYHGCRGKTFEGKNIPEILAPAENVVLPMTFQSQEERQNHATAAYDHLPEGYARTEGTSFAAPIILGCAACVWEAHPDWTASQIKSAILDSSIKSDAWKELNAGLIDVASAMNSTPSRDNSDLPYATWNGWKSKKETVRLKALQERDEELVTSVLLSFCDDVRSSEIEEHVRVLLDHQSDKIRTAVITTLAFNPDTITSDDLRHLLRANSSYLRMGALFALRRCPSLWDEFTDEVSRLFTDPDLNLRYCAIELAAVINKQCFIEPLISGLYEDAQFQRVSIFGTRCNALEILTGIAFDPVPEWLEGQCWYSDRSTQARLHIAQKWGQWRGY
ncbi:S8 family serine peptidase [Paenibacillus sp. GCM10027626]|uniref:S8 family serine peptidase n=1 Tax=Paenibacillus sp. GCM10027626 TaxID=3273411 RepID=UPI0036269A0C